MEHPLCVTARTYLKETILNGVMTDSETYSPLNPEDRDALCHAAQLLESPGFFIRAINFIGAPIHTVLRKLPRGVEERIRSAVSVSLERALDLALYRFEDNRGLFQREGAMKGLVAVTGAAAGAFGLGALAIELPISTCMMLRSIAEIARAEGEDLRTPAGKLACVEVFALGGKAASDDDAESAYYATRVVLGQEVRAALRYLAQEPTERVAAPGHRPYAPSSRPTLRSSDL
jgi:hypothetical protein